MKTSVYPNQITRTSPSKVTLLTRNMKWKSLFSQSAVHLDDNSINHSILYKNARAWKLSLKRICDSFEMKAHFIIFCLCKNGSSMLKERMCYINFLCSRYLLWSEIWRGQRKDNSKYFYRFREWLTVMSVISFFSLTLIFRPLELEVKMHIFHWKVK